MNKKIIKFGIWGLVTILILSLTWYFVMTNALVVFDLPDKKVITSKCDYEGLRQGEIYRLEGNATTNPSIHVSVHLDCDYSKKQTDEKLIFTADDSALADNDVNISWVTFDTLLIEYKKGLKVFTQLDKIEYPDSTLNLYVIYKKVE